MECRQCGADLDLTMGKCPACGAAVELGRLTGILGIVCRACDAYNEPNARTCVGCGKPIGASGAAPPPPDAPAPPSPPLPGSSGAPARPATGRQAPRAQAATRFVPAAARPAAAKPAPEEPALTPIPLLTTCPRCGAEAGSGRFCSRCGQGLGIRGTQVVMRPSTPGRTATQAFGPLAPGRAKLVLESGQGFDGAVFRLNAEAVEAGRSRGAVIFPEDDCLAPHHATFFYRNGSLHVRDEGAPGGIYLRLRGISVPLRAGDHFAIGDRLFRFAGTLPPPPTPPPDGTRRLGAPRPTVLAAVLEEWLEGGAGGRVFVRPGPAITIGRAGCAVNLGDDPRLSQAHAEVLMDAGGRARLKDLGSTNGTYVRIPPHAERELHDGDCIRMGREVLRVSVA